MSEPRTRVSVVPLVWYERPREAIDWLERAFGFETLMVVSGDGESVIHSELTLGDGAIYVVGPPGGGAPGAGPGGATPAQLGGKNTQIICINLAGDLDARCEAARAAGAIIEREPADQAYGDRVFTCRDPEGHAWAFAQPTKPMSAAEMASATGRKIDTKEDTRG